MAAATLQTSASRPWYNRAYRRDKRLALINSTIVPLIRAARRTTSRLFPSDYSVVRHEPHSDACVDYMEIRLEPRPHVIVTYVTTRKVVTPRDLKVMLRRMNSWLRRHAPPVYDVTYAIIGDNVWFTYGVVKAARELKIVLDDKGGVKLRRRLLRYYAERLSKLYEAVKRAMARGRANLTGARLLMAILSGILAWFYNIVDEKMLARKVKEVAYGLSDELVYDVLRALGVGPPPWAV